MKHIKTKMFFTLFFIGNTIISMDIIKVDKTPSVSTQKAIDAIENDSPKDLAAALAMGADISHISKRNNNLLLLATRKGKEKTALYLVIQPHFQNNTVINEQNIFGETVLICAAYQGYKTLVENLLKIKNINLDLQDVHGYDALFTAITREKSDITKLLMEYNANPTIQNEHGATTAFSRNILSNSTIDSSIRTKIIKAKDINGNSQLHLLVAADIGKMANTSKKTIDSLFSNILENLIKHGTSIWEINNYNMLPVETAFQKYNELHQQFALTKRSYLKKRLDNQEKILHILLLYYLKETSGKPILISTPSHTHGLNIETVIAQKYNQNECYYKDYTIEYKDKLKQQLWAHQINIPPVWISHVYIAPTIIDEYGDTNYNSLK